MKKNRRWLKISIMVFCLGALILFLIVRIINGFEDIQGSFSMDLPTTNSLPSEDSGILAEKYRAKLKVEEIINFKHRDHISVLLFNQRYHLIITKIALEKNASLKDILHETTESVDRTTGEVYSILDLDDSYEFQYRSSYIKPVSHIFITLSGDSLQSLKNDSVTRYHLLCKNLSIRFADKEAVDIYMTGKEKLLMAKPDRSMDLLFLKRGLRVYILIMTPVNPEINLSPDLLNDIVTGL